MNKIVKNIITLSIYSALSINFVNTANAATYKIVERSEVNTLKHTYAQHQNVNGDMAISGTSNFNFPVQFEYLDEDDFDSIESYALLRYERVHELNDIENSDALRAGSPTANDLAWVIRWLQDTSTGKGLDIKYQKVGDTIAMTSLNGVTENYNLWDEKFVGTDQFTKSTIDIISGITDNGIYYGTATAPYLPSELFTDSNNEEHTFWLREHSLRGFFSYGQAAQVHQITPFETQYAGGTSSIMDVNKEGTAVGFSSYKINQSFIDYIEDETGGCADPDKVPGEFTLEACIAEYQLRNSAYHSMALKATLSLDGTSTLEQLGLLVTPHPDDERPYSSYALAVNNSGTAVGYAEGFTNEAVTEPAVDERRQFRDSDGRIKNYHFAVVYKNGEVTDLTGDHSSKGSSRAYDINDAGVAVGHISKVISGRLVQKFFYVDTNTPKEEINMVTPSDYFSGSDSTARAINSSGLIVGEGEIETHNESSDNLRRTSAFVYDMQNDIFTNLNETIPCSLRQSYDILEARGITDAGLISASAVVKVDRRDAKGEIVLDASGTPLKEDVIRSITLEPIPDDSEVCTAEEVEKVVRKGSSVSFGSFLTIMALFGLRRKHLN